MLGTYLNSFKNILGMHFTKRDTVDVARQRHQSM
jgi:hypothetical protein